MQGRRVLQDSAVKFVPGEEETLGLCKTFQSTTSCPKHRRMSERGETDSHSIGSSDKFRATAVRRNVVNHQTR
ncbi:hypothetical protein TNCV_650041 [Trichonephila clavipes]|nr:hypothetical protein TNCV_650041 [Trichonephila clavipes]